ncbi:MAG: nucleotide sugar dehydrogenase, partial [Hydrogenobaculum sp.]
MIKAEDFLNKKESICVVGLGYVGLPLAVAFAKHFNVIGFDINQIRINELKLGIDRTKETTSEELLNSNIFFTSNEEHIKKCKFIIITVPTPIDKHKVPDLKPIFSASTIVGRNLQKDSIVVYESTVYPGLTEEECVPILEKESGLTWKKDFFVGYSPERINPGDKIHRFENIVKVVSGDTDYSLNIISEIYSKVVKAGIFKAKSIKVAEAAKVIENTQRDINIALMNELSMIFHKIGIDTKDVLEAAATKWNFLKFEPGLVGGHCISVDPYYLTFKAQELGH